MSNIAMLILGIFISVLGVVNILGNVSTIHSYNRRRVREEDIPRYGRVMGTGTLIMGAALMASYILSLWREDLVVWVIIPAFIVGLGLMLYGQFKYNGGLF